MPYEHKVQALTADGRSVRPPVNRCMIEAVFDVELADSHAVAAFPSTQAKPIETPANAGEHLRSQIGRTLTDLFFRSYTGKMWNLDLGDLSAAVAQRVPVRMDDEDRYFPTDKFQIMPRDG